MSGKPLFQVEEWISLFLYLGCKWKSEGLAFEGKEFIEELERRINGPRGGGEDGT